MKKLDIVEINMRAVINVAALFVCSKVLAHVFFPMTTGMPLNELFGFLKDTVGIPELLAVVVMCRIGWRK